MSDCAIHPVGWQKIKFYSQSKVISNTIDCESLNPNNLTVS